MLKGNIYSLNRCPVYFTGGTVNSCERSNSVSPGRLRNQFISLAGREPISGIPNGYLAPASWLLPMQAGSLSSYKSEGITILLSGDAVMGSNTDGSVSIDLIATGSIGYIEKINIDGAAALTLTATASGELITQLDINGTAQISLSVVASGDSLAFAVGEALITLDVSSQLSSTIQGSASCLITLTTTGDLDGEGYLGGNAPITISSASISVLAYGFMTGDTASAGGDVLTSDAIALAVWAYVMTNSKTAEENLIDAKNNSANAFAVSA